MTTTDGLAQVAPRRRRSSPAVDKVSTVLKAIAASRTPMTFSELAARVPFARSSLHDVCSGLLRNEFINKTNDGRYEIGMLVVELSRKRIGSMNIVREFQNTVARRDSILETVVLAVPSGSDVTYVAFVDSGRPLAVRYEIGMRLPAAFTATGKALLATRPSNEVARMYDTEINNPNPQRPSKPRAKLLEEMVNTRASGFSTDDEETAAGMICFGVPVFSALSDAATGAIAISLVKGSDFEVNPGQKEYLHGIARDVSIQLGGDTSWFD